MNKQKPIINTKTSLKNLKEKRRKLRRKMDANSAKANILLKREESITELMKANDELLLEIVELNKRIFEINGIKLRVV